MVNDFGKLFKDVSFILKLVAFILLIVISSFSSSYAVYQRYEGTEEMIVMGVYTSQTILLAILLVYIFDTPHKLYNMAYMIIGGVFCVLAGILCFISYAALKKNKYPGDYDNDKLGLSVRTIIVAVLSLVAGVIMILDFVLTLLSK